MPGPCLFFLAIIKGFHVLNAPLYMLQCEYFLCLGGREVAWEWDGRSHIQSGRYCERGRLSDFQTTFTPITPPVLHDKCFLGVLRALKSQPWIVVLSTSQQSIPLDTYTRLSIGGVVVLTRKTYRAINTKTHFKNSIPVIHARPNMTTRNYNTRKTYRANKYDPAHFRYTCNKSCARCAN